MFYVSIIIIIKSLNAIFENFSDKSYTRICAVFVIYVCKLYSQVQLTGCSIHTFYSLSKIWTELYFWLLCYSDKDKHVNKSEQTRNTAKIWHIPENTFTNLLAVTKILYTKKSVVICQPYKLLHLSISLIKKYEKKVYISYK